MSARTRPKPDVSEAQVSAFLRANPRFLAEHPTLYRTLAPPVRHHGDRLADHMAAMLRMERLHAAAMAERADGVLAAGRAAAGLAGRVNEAVIALLRSPCPRDCVSAEIPALLGVDCASLCTEEEAADMRHLPAGTVAALLGGRAAVFRTAPPDAAALHGEAARLARHDALVRVPGDGVPCLLALGARDPSALDPAQGTGALAFLGRALAASLGR